jgi:hypothetical protein
MEGSMSGHERLDPFVSVVAARARERAAEHDPADLPLSDGELATARDRILAALDAKHPPAPRATGRRFARWTTLGIASLATAAALALRLGAAPAAPLDAREYTVSVTGHVESERAATRPPASTLQSRAGAVQEVVLRPRAPVASAIEAGVLVVRGGQAAPLAARTDVTDRGVVRFTVDGDALVGASEVRVVLTRDEGRSETVTIPIEN